MSERSVIAIVGPTATGKSAVADAVAKELGCGVVSADAMQVYEGMDIGTAKTPEAERSVPLHLVDVVPIGEAYSAALYQRDARAAIEAELESFGHAVLCGGTGLYVKAALDEMDFPRGHGSSPSRKRWEERAAEIGGEALWEELASRDAASAALIHPHNVRRTIRALEMADEGVSYAEQARGLHEGAERYPTLLFGLTMARERLYEAIESRVDAMMEAGFLDEVRALRERGLASCPTASQAIGYAELLRHLEGSLPLDEAVDAVKRRTRRYAKRQLTWFRRDPRIRWLPIDEMGAEAVVRSICERVGGSA